MGVIEYELLLDGERKPVLVKKNSEFSDADEFLDSPSKIAQMFMVRCNAEYLPEEHIWMLALNVKCKPIGMFEVAHGTNRNCMTSPRELFVRACVSGCDCIAVVHNHPSGICTPSSEDDSLTKRLVEAGGLLGIPVVDHVIIGKDSYYSYAEQNEELLKTKQDRKERNE